MTSASGASAVGTAGHLGDGRIGTVGCACEKFHEGCAATVYARPSGHAEGPVQQDGPLGSPTSRAWCEPAREWCATSVLEGVLHLLAGLLEVGLGLVALALTAQCVIPGGRADLLLGMPAHVLHLVLGLVVGTHVERSLRSRQSLSDPA